ncbi:MAG: MOSC domain-containing protein [Actinomycetota bacterium]|nr:MOSC domain-containing protein [Actinomycetota bacterium]
MRLLSVNVGGERPIENGKASRKSGIYKRPVDGPVWITALGLAGDTISDTENHGGEDQAVYVYTVPDYDWWSEELGRELSPGTFGENLTITDFESADAFIGDRLHVGEVVLEVTAPRIPCATLAVRMKDPKFVKRFRSAERLGFYCRVIREGEVRAGDPMTLERYTGETISAIEMFRDFFEPGADEEKIRRHLAAPVAVRDRVEKERQLGEILTRRSANR